MEEAEGRQSGFAVNEEFAGFRLDDHHCLTQYNLDYVNTGPLFPSTSMRARQETPQRGRTVEKPQQPLLAVGWDVGGWRGKNQAVAVAEFKGGPLRPERIWRGHPKTFSLRQLEQLSLFELIRQGWSDLPGDFLERYRVVVAVDAPFGFPQAFRRLLNTQRVPRPTGDKKHIENRLAYRYTDRWVCGHFKKMPLSASFDKLGNNATVALLLLRQFSKDTGLPVLPFERMSRRGGFIEVYPALVKEKWNGKVAGRLSRMMPFGMRSGTHEYDAAICALMALAFHAGPRAGLPKLVPPPRRHTVVRQEGWIYCPNADWVR